MSGTPETGPAEGVRYGLAEALSDICAAAGVRGEAVASTHAILARLVAGLRADLTKATRENDHLRASLANGSGPCAYCALSRKDWAKCASGFSGCGRADDAVLCPHFSDAFDAEEARDAAVKRANNLERAYSNREFDLAEAENRADAAEAARVAAVERVERAEGALKPFAMLADDVLPVPAGREHEPYEVTVLPAALEAARAAVVYDAHRESTADAIRREIAALRAEGGLKDNHIADLKAALEAADARYADAINGPSDGAEPHPYEVIGTTWDGVKVLRGVMRSENFTESEIREAIQVAMAEVEAAALSHRPAPAAGPGPTELDQGGVGHA